MFDALEAINDIIDEINNDTNESYYEAICDELDTRVENGDLTLEDAQVIADRAADTYLEGRMLSDAIDDVYTQTNRINKSKKWGNEGRDSRIKRLKDVQENLRKLAKEVSNIDVDDYLEERAAYQIYREAQREADKAIRLGMGYNTDDLTGEGRLLKSVATNAAAMYKSKQSKDNGKAKQAARGEVILHMIKLDRKCEKLITKYSKMTDEQFTTKYKLKKIGKGVAIGAGVLAAASGAGEVIQRVERRAQRNKENKNQ